MNCSRELLGALIIGLVGMMAQMSPAATWHVSPNGNDGNSGATWALAKKTIQAGVNAAGNGDTVLVTNGEYVLSGQVTVSKIITVRSVNGPAVTIVNGNGQITSNRCFYLGPNCTLDGLTVTNGYAFNASGGGVYCVNSSAIIINCTLSGNSATYYGGGTYCGTVNNCTLTANSAAYDGGGATDSTLNDCMISGNSTPYGGGAYNSTLNYCTITGNSATSHGGGAYFGTLNNCTITGNSAGYRGGGAADNTLNNCAISGNSAANDGGGTYFGILNSCAISANSATYSGGGTYYGTLNNCTLSANSAAYGGGTYNGTFNNCTLSANSAGYGGGAYYGTLNNCSLTANSATSGNGGGVYGGTLNNCIAYYNSGTNNFVGAAVRYTCAPDAPAGFGNVTFMPMFVNTNTGNYRLSAGSPCINAGNNQYAPTNATPADLDGNVRIWNITVDMGAYEYGSPVYPYYASYLIYLNYTYYYFNRYAATRSSTDLYWGYYCYAYAGFYSYLSFGTMSQAYSFYYYYMCCANLALADDYSNRFTRTGSHLYLGYYCYYTAFAYFYGYMHAEDSYNAYRWYNYYMYYADWYWHH